MRIFLTSKRLIMPALAFAAIAFNVDAMAQKTIKIGASAPKLAR